MFRTNSTTKILLLGAVASGAFNAQICKPAVGSAETVVTAAQRLAAAKIALPPLTDHQNGFAWPDSEFGVFKTTSGYAFFASDGGYHAANNKYGSVTRT